MAKCRYDFLDHVDDHRAFAEVVVLRKVADECDGTPKADALRKRAKQIEAQYPRAHEGICSPWNER